MSMIPNPLTGRFIQAGGGTHKLLMKKGVLDLYGNLNQSGGFSFKNFGKQKPPDTGDNTGDVFFSAPTTTLWSSDIEDLEFDEPRPRISEVLDRYGDEIEYLGFGSYGMVFSAVRKSDNLPIALKMFLPTTNLASAKHEAQMMVYLKELQHDKCTEHIICYLAHFKAPIGTELLEAIRGMPDLKNLVDGLTAKSELLFIESKLEPGITLRKAMSGLTRAYFLSERPDVLVKLLKSVAGAVRFLHAHDVYHRDIKPANVMMLETIKDLSYDGVLLDVGASCRVEKCRSTPTFGTLAYLPIAIQHQIVGKPSKVKAIIKEISKPDMLAAMDVYALGATFFDFLDGAPPESADTKREIPPTSSTNKLRDLWLLVEKMLVWPPKITIEQVWQDLNRLELQLAIS
jgi:serine/threonine protein kinase